VIRLLIHSVHYKLKAITAECYYCLESITISEQRGARCRDVILSTSRNLRAFPEDFFGILVYTAMRYINNWCFTCVFKPSFR